LRRLSASREEGSVPPAPMGALLPLVAAILLLVPSVGAVAAEREMPPPPAVSQGGEGTRFAEPGTIAPDFTVLDIEGRPFRLSEEVARKPVLLLFWSVFCEPCRNVLTTLRKSQARYAARDVDVVAVAVDGEPLRNTIGGFARQEGYAFTVLVDEPDAAGAWKIADAYGVASIPTLVLLEKGGVVALRREGRIRGDELEKAVASLPKN